LDVEESDAEKFDQWKFIEGVASVGEVRVEFLD
jgi:hypothetical protein